VALPKGWTDCRLDDANTIIAGQSPESKFYNENGDGLPFFQGKTDFGQLYPANRVYCTEPKKLAEGGDILLSVRAPVGPTNLARETVAIGRGINAIRPLGGVSTKYVLYFFKHIEPVFSGSGTGTTFSAVTVDAVKSLSFSLAPLAEQHRIVEKIVALFSKLDKGMEMLKTVHQQLRMYRQAVLKWAFEGKEWEFKPFSDVAPSRLGKMLDKQKNTGTLQQYLRNVNVRWLGFDCTDIFEMRIEDFEVEKYLVRKGDLLICEGGEPGRCAIWKSEQPIAFQKALHRVRPTTEITAEFLMYFIYYLANTGGLKQYFTGSGINHLTGESLNKIPVPIPTTNTQRLLVSEIESRLSVCDKLEQIVDETLVKTQALRQSILKKAFTGQLVPQDPNDEPAEKLLERIKAARAAATTKTKATRGTRK
jgi:type I restriction enzyme S subunit